MPFDDFQILSEIGRGKEERKKETKNERNNKLNTIK